MHINRLCGNLLPLLVATSVGLAVTAKAAEEKVSPEHQPSGATSSVRQMQQDFLKLKFVMFIHFNLETFKGVQWVAGYHSPADFSPGGKVDTDAWADAAVSAGMKYAVLTAKHVSGFCLWDSKYTTYDVMNPACPYQQDLVAQFIKSFKSRGLKVGLYYCWRHPGFSRVYLVDDTEPSIGGMMARLDKTFPTNDCSICIEAPQMYEVDNHEQTEILTHTELRRVQKAGGAFKVRLLQKAKFIDETKCTGCGACVEACPVSVAEELDGKVGGRRKLISMAFPQAVPNKVSAWMVTRAMPGAVPFHPWVTAHGAPEALVMVATPHSGSRSIVPAGEVIAPTIRRFYLTD